MCLQSRSICLQDLEEPSTPCDPDKIEKHQMEETMRTSYFAFILLMLVLRSGGLSEKAPIGSNV